jgi:hypothetical protein
MKRICVSLRGGKGGEGGGSTTIGRILTLEKHQPQCDTQIARMEVTLVVLCCMSGAIWTVSAKGVGSVYVLVSVEEKEGKVVVPRQ